MKKRKTHSKFRNSHKKRNMFIVVAISLFFIASIFFVAFPPSISEQDYLLIGLNNNVGLRVINLQTFTEEPFTLAELPTSYNYLLESYGENLYIYTPGSSPVLYSINTKTGETKKIFFAGSQYLKDLLIVNEQLYGCGEDYSTQTFFIVEIDLNPFQIKETHQIPVNGLPYKMAADKQNLFLVAYNVSSQKSYLAKFSLTPLRMLKTVSVHVDASRDLALSEEKIFIRGTNEVVVYTKTLTFLQRIKNIRGWGQIIYSHEKIYAAGYDLNKPALYTINCNDYSYSTKQLTTYNGFACILLEHNGVVYVGGWRKESNSEGACIFKVVDGQISEISFKDSTNCWPVDITCFKG